MKRMLPSLVATLTLTLSLGSAISVIAQDPPPQPGGPDGMRLPPNPFFVALDLDKDGEISAAELAKATQSLKALDKDGDGKLTREEVRPPRPEGDQGQGGRGREGRPSRDRNQPPRQQ